MNTVTLLRAGAAGMGFLLALGAAADAATTAPPKISGTYLVDYIETCQASTSDQTSSGYLTGLNSVSNGKITHTILTLKFTQTAKTSTSWSGTLAMTAGWETHGDLWADLDSPGGLTTMTTDAASAPGTSWSSTATTLTFSGNGSVTFKVLFGPVSSGIAQSAMFSGIPDNSSACAATGTAIRTGS